MGKKRMGERWELGIRSWGLGKKRMGGWGGGEMGGKMGVGRQENLVTINSSLFPLLRTRNSELGTRNSELTQHSALLNPLGTRNSELGTNSALSTFHSALKKESVAPGNSNRRRTIGF
uniref:Uncharacterized protein n=1 Tax=Desertifilum tharense IPPAS B-1220 TaxID=1781255 RepID=A0ACD5GZW9_9CYAN